MQQVILTSKRANWLQKPGLLAVVLSAATLCGACETTKIVGTAEPFCEAVKHVCVSKADTLTPSTARQVLANNMGRKPLCPPPPGGDPCAEMRDAKPSSPVPAPKSQDRVSTAPAAASQARVAGL